MRCCSGSASILHCLVHDSVLPVAHQICRELSQMLAHLRHLRSQKVDMCRLSLPIYDDS